MNNIEAAKARASKFHGRQGQVVGKTDFEVPSALVLMGEGVAIEYRSDKPIAGKGKAQRVFRHKFGRGVKIYCDPKGKTILVFGGRMTVTDWIRY
jgi:hypothetical protein